jgi:hypothetical protein
MHLCCLAKERFTLVYEFNLDVLNQRAARAQRFRYNGVSALHPVLDGRLCHTWAPVVTGLSDDAVATKTSGL